jgi:hypothetical protein
MAAKKTGKKKVTIEIDEETLQKLAAAAESLAEVASSVVQCATDPAVRARLQKGAKKKR